MYLVTLYISLRTYFQQRPKKVIKITNNITVNFLNI